MEWTLLDTYAENIYYQKNLSWSYGQASKCPMWILVSPEIITKAQLPNHVTDTK